MATTKKRLNITLTPALEDAISFLAKKDNVPEATKAAELLKNAVLIEEDAILLELAQERDTKDAKYVGEDTFWKTMGV